MKITAIYVSPEGVLKDGSNFPVEPTYGSLARLMYEHDLKQAKSEALPFKDQEEARKLILGHDVRNNAQVFTLSIPIQAKVETPNWIHPEEQVLVLLPKAEEPFSKLAENMKDIDPEIQRAVNKRFMDLIEGTAGESIINDKVNAVHDLFRVKAEESQEDATLIEMKRIAGLAWDASSKYFYQIDYESEVTAPNKETFINQLLPTLIRKP
jgi:hypothetical protein